MVPEEWRDVPTDRQRDVLELAVLAAADGWPFPAIREIGDSLHINSTNGVADHLRALERKGYIERSHRSAARGWRLTNKARKLYGLPQLPLPLIGLRAA